MTNEQILKKAIEKAVKGGWLYGEYKLLSIEGIEKYNVRLDNETATSIRVAETIKVTQIQNIIPTVIFNHNFAKAFWGEKESMIEGHYEGVIKEGWQYHLQQLVLEPEPLKYLEKFL